MADNDNRVRVKLTVDEPDLRRQVESMSAYMQDSLSKAATEAIKSALNQSFKFSGQQTTKFTPGGAGSGTGGNTGGNTGSGTGTGGNGSGSSSNNDSGGAGKGTSNTQETVLRNGIPRHERVGNPTVSSYRKSSSANGQGDFSQQTSYGNKQFYTAMQDVNKNISALNSAIRERSRTTTVASRTGQVTYNQNERMQSTKESITQAQTPGTFANAGKTYKDTLSQLDNQYNDLAGQLQKAKSAGDSGSVNDLKLQMNQNQELTNAYQKYISALDRAAESLNKQDQSMANVNGGRGVNVAAKRGSVLAAIQDRSFATGARMAGGVASGVTGMYTSGMQINQRTGQQALELGTLAGGLSDQQVREQVQSYRGTYGYNTQQGLDFYQQAMRQKGPALTADQAQSRVKEIESQGRASGLNEQTYTDLLNTSAGAGAVNSNSDMRSIVQTVLAANAMSGNSGNKEQNTQTLTSLISSIGATRNVSVSAIANTGVMQSALSSAGKSWQGDAGASNIQSMNASYQSASKGQNNSLLYLIMRQRGQGGVVGYQNAQIQAEKGLSDPNNIKALRQYVSSMSRSGATGRAMAATYINNSGMTKGPEAAKELVDDISNGKLSDSQIAERQKKAKSTGKKEDKKGASAYKKSDLSVLNTHSANLDRNESKMASDLKDLTKTANAINHTLIGAVAMSAVTSIAGTAVGSAGGSIFSGITHSKGFTNLAGIGKETAEGTSKGATFFSRAGSGIKNAASSVSNGVRGVFTKDPLNETSGFRYRAGAGLNRAVDAIKNGSSRAGDAIKRGTGSIARGAKNMFSPEAGTEGGFRATLSNATSRAGSALKGGASRVGSGIRNLFSSGAEGVEGASKGAGFLSRAGSAVKGAASSGILSRAGRLLGRVATPLTVVAGAADTVHNVNKAKSGKGKAKAAGQGIGSTGGILAGGALGAKGGAAAGGAIGSAFGGVGAVPGAAIGGVVGGIGGAVAGSSVGKAVGGWVGDKAHGAWDWITGNNKSKSQTNKSKSSSKNQSSKKKIATSQSLINQKNQQQMLDQWQKIMDTWTKNIKATNSANGSSGKATAKNSSKKSSSKSGHAFGGLVTQRTEIAEGDKPEYVVPLDPAKQNSTKNALSQITQMTGIRSTDDKPQVVTQAGTFSPNITINHNGTSGGNDDDVLITKLNQALKNATDDYRFNFQKR